MHLTIPNGSLMETVLAGQRVEASLTEPATLSGAVRELSDAVARMGDVPVVVVGQAAAMIVGAAVVASGGHVRHAVLPAVGGTDDKALVVQAVAVGEAGVQRAVSDARRDGAAWVGAWVWRAAERFDTARTEADEVYLTEYAPGD